MPHILDVLVYMDMFCVDIKMALNAKDKALRVYEYVCTDIILL